MKILITYCLVLLVLSVFSNACVEAQSIENNRRCYEDDECIFANISPCLTPICIFFGNGGVGDDPNEDPSDSGKGHCEYLEYSCEDSNICTINERCVESNGHPMCVADPNPACSNTTTTTPYPTTTPTSHPPLPPFCPIHSVNLTVTDYCSLNITRVHCEGEAVFQICLTKRIPHDIFIGEPYQLVLGFDEYSECNINKRGTCDNLPAVHETVPSLCLADSEYHMNPPCCDQHSHISYAFRIPGFPGGEYFVFSNTAAYRPSIAFPEFDVAHLHGEIAAIHNSTIRLRVDLRFTGFNNDYSNAHLPLDDSCYEEEGFPGSWKFYNYVTGSIYAMPGSPLVGLYLLVNGDAFLQIGFGANGRALVEGAYLNAEFTVAHQPISGNTIFTCLPGNPALIGSFETPSMCSDELEYCDLFESHTPDNGWVLTYPMGMPDTIRYCRNFTISELVGCRPYGLPHELLFIAEDHSQWNTNNCMVYNGRLYSTLVLGDTCTNHICPDSPFFTQAHCGELVISQYAHDIRFRLDASGEIVVSHQASRLEFDVIWLRNIWTCDNCLKVVIRTITRHQLTSIIVLRDPYFVVSPWPATISSANPTHPGCLPDSPSGYCYQDWEIISVNCAGAHNHHFEGSFRVRWHYGTLGNEVESWVHVDAEHYGEDHYLEDTVLANLQLYSNHEDVCHQHRCDDNDCSHSYSDCDVVFGRLSLCNYDWLEPRIIRVYVGFWSDSHHSPHNSCLDSGVSRHLIYDVWECVALDDFEIVPCDYCDDDDDDDDEEPAVCFTFTAHRYGEGQLLHVVWEAIGDGGATIEGFIDIRHENAPEDSPERHIASRFFVGCPSGQSWSHGAGQCTTNHVENNNESHNTNTNTAVSNSNSNNAINVDNDVHLNLDIAAIAEAIAIVEQESTNYIRYSSHHGRGGRPPSSFDDYDDDDSDGVTKWIKVIVCGLLFILLLLFLFLALKICCCRRCCVLPCYTHWKQNCDYCAPKSRRHHTCTRPAYCEVCSHSDSDTTVVFTSESDSDNDRDRNKQNWKKAISRMENDTSRSEKEKFEAFLSESGGGYWDSD